MDSVSRRPRQLSCCSTLFAALMYVMIFALAVDASCRVEVFDAMFKLNVSRDAGHRENPAPLRVPVAAARGEVVQLQAWVQGLSRDPYTVSVQSTTLPTQRFVEPLITC